MKSFSGDIKKIEQSIKSILEYVGEDPSREGLRDTPDRVIKSFDRLYGGYLQEPAEIFTFFEDDGVVPVDQIILLRDIELYSTCEHHMLPFFGKAHIAYIPRDKVVGVSKLARLLEVYSRRLQIQERIGTQVTSALMEFLSPQGAACIIECTHFCMTGRGVEKQNSTMVTSSLTGVFMEEASARQELMTLIFK